MDTDVPPLTVTLASTVDGSVDSILFADATSFCHSEAEVAAHVSPEGRAPEHTCSSGSCADAARLVAVTLAVPLMA